MTIVTIYKKNGSIIGYEGKGHSGYSKQGSDIICASISTALQMPLIGMQDIMKANPKFVINDEGYLEVDLKNLKSEEIRKISLTLESMVLFIEELSKQYPKNIKLVVKEEK